MTLFILIETEQEAEVQISMHVKEIKRLEDALKGTHNSNDDILKQHIESAKEERSSFLQQIDKLNTRIQDLQNTIVKQMTDGDSSKHTNH